ncbi:hypothetical protein ILYODFUR_028877, partial [Ilyodon furcidens]
LRILRNNWTGVFFALPISLHMTGLRGHQTQQRHPDVPLPRHLLPPPPEGAQGVPRPVERHSPFSMSWTAPWASSW